MTVRERPGPTHPAPPPLPNPALDCYIKSGRSKLHGMDRWSNDYPLCAGLTALVVAPALGVVLGGLIVLGLVMLLRGVGQ